MNATGVAAASVPDQRGLNITDVQPQWQSGDRRGGGVLLGGGGVCDRCPSCVAQCTVPGLFEDFKVADG